MKRLDLRGRIALGVLVVAALAGICAPWLAPYGPSTQLSNSALLHPGAAHWLGTDDLGRDVYSRVLYGIRTDLAVGALAIPLAVLAAAVLALLGTAWRPFDAVLQRVFDTVLAFPPLVLAIAVTTVLGPGLSSILTAVAVCNVPLYGRLVRTGVLAQRDRDHVLAMRLAGAGRIRILLRHILPNALDPLIVQTALSLSAAVFLEGGMSFVGIGVRPPGSSLGGMLNEAVSYLGGNPAFALGPLLAVGLLVLALNLLADSLTALLRG